MRYPRMSVSDRVAALSDAVENGAKPLEYPSWFMHHRHFLPGGYLSRRSAALYEKLVAPIYNLPTPAWVRARVARQVARFGPRRILELGCGTGAMLAALRHHHPEGELEGVELSPFLLGTARQTLTSGERTLELHHADAASFESHARFDAVVAVHLLGHIPLDHAKAIFANAAVNLLAPGGILHVVEHRWHSAEWSTANASATEFLTPLLIHRSYTGAGERLIG